MNNRAKGGVAEADAIRYFAALGYVPCWPMVPTEYDLLVHEEGRWNRVQCKFSGRFRGYGYVVGLLAKHRDGAKTVHMGYDELYVLTADGQRYRIPATDIMGKRSLKLQKRWRVEDAFHPSSAAGVGRCKRCQQPYNGLFAVCDKCRTQVRETQKRYRARKP